MTNDTQSCQAESCKQPPRAKGYCNRHYKAWKRGEMPHGRYRTCNTEGCRKKWFAEGLCEEHHKARTGKKGGEAPPAKAVAAPVEAKKAEEVKKPEAPPPEAPPAA